MFERSRSVERLRERSLSAAEFERTFGEDLGRTLDVNAWRVGNDLAAEYARIDTEVQQAVREEDALQERIRTIVFPKLAELEKAPNAGVHAARHGDLEAV